MTRILAIILAFGLAAPIHADDLDPLAEYEWLARPLVIFADRADDPRFLRQIEMLEAYPEDLAERDIVVLTDADPAAGQLCRAAAIPQCRPRLHGGDQDAGDRAFGARLRAPDALVARRRCRALPSASGPAVG